jgi:hypothetical protein
MKEAPTIVIPSKARDLLLFVFNKKQQMLSLRSVESRA